MTSDSSEFSEESVEMATTSTTCSIPEELVYKLIKYVTKSTRLLFVQQPEVWSKFETTKYAENYMEYSAQQLCNAFVEEVLPSIYKFDLTKEEVLMFGLLELNPEFEAISDGYKRTKQRVAKSRQPQVGIDYQVTTESEIDNIQFLLRENTASSSDQFQLDSTRPANTIAILQTYRNQGYNFQFSAKNFALLSAAFSNDYELYANDLLEPKKLKSRLILAKRNFEQNAVMPECRASKLLEKVEKSRKLMNAISDIMINNFSK